MAKKTRRSGLSNLECAQELQSKVTAVLSSSPVTSLISLMNISLWCSFSTITAPTGPNDAGTENLASYVPSFFVLCANPTTLSFSNPVSTHKIFLVRGSELCRLGDRGKSRTSRPFPAYQGTVGERDICICM